MRTVVQVWLKEHVMFPHAEPFIVLPMPKAGLHTKIEKMMEMPLGVEVHFESLKEHRSIVIPWSNIKNYEVKRDIEVEAPKTAPSKSSQTKSKPAKVVSKKLPKSKKSST